MYEHYRQSFVNGIVYICDIRFVRWITRFPSKLKNLNLMNLVRVKYDDNSGKIIQQCILDIRKDFEAMP